MNKIPLLIIIGATGTGKTKLSVQLAKKFNGEIVNADLLQMYHGLSIITAKPTTKEMDGIKHNLISILPPKQNMTVHKYKKMASNIILDIYKRGKLPILVGGNMYYIQSLIWDNLIEESISDQLNISLSKEKNLWEKLNKIDPIRASELHPNDTRKIINSIKIYEKSGKLHSDLIKEQIKKGGGLGGKSMYNYKFIWLDCNREVHLKRLNNRIDKMIQDGLKKEIKCLYEFLIKDNFDMNKINQGILQAIGFKEFKQYFESSYKDEYFIKGIELLRIHTRQYAKRQIKWIKNRLIKKGIKVIKLDTTQDWDNHVLKPALKISSYF